MHQSAPTIDENASKDMGSVIKGLKELQKLIKGLIIVVHHTGKTENKGLRGHSSLHAAMDAEIEVQGEADKQKKCFKTTKVKDGSVGTIFPFELIPVDLAEDEDGELITSCFVKPTPSAELENTTNGMLGENQKITVEVIDELVKANGDNAEGEDDWQLNFDEVRKAIAERLTHVEKKRRTSRATEALKGLLNNGYYRHQGDFLLHG
jgi:hypothetical protein